MNIGFISSPGLSALLTPLQILLVNLLLSADNALVIAMASRGLPAEAARRASLLGIVGAILLRLALGSVAIFLLRIPLVQLVAGLVLLVLAVRLARAKGGDGGSTNDPVEGSATVSSQNFLAVVWAIVLADVAVSLDNVVILSAIARGSVIYLALGLAISIPVLLWGSALIRRFLDRSRYLVLLGGMFLGWVAGEIAVSDPIVAPTLAASASLWRFAAPLACVLLILFLGLRQRSRRERIGG